MIDGVVNAHGGQRFTSGEIAVSNLLAILRGCRRRNEDLYTALRQLVWKPECAINPEKRAAFARKWAARIARST